MEFHACSFLSGDIRLKNLSPHENSFLALPPQEEVHLQTQPHQDALFHFQ